MFNLRVLRNKYYLQNGSLTGLILPGSEFPKPYMVVFLFQWFEEVLAHFVDIGGIDGHHCLNFLFIIL